MTTAMETCQLGLLQYIWASSENPQSAECKPRKDNEIQRYWKKPSSKFSAHRHLLVHVNEHQVSETAPKLSISSLNDYSQSVYL